MIRDSAVAALLGRLVEVWNRGDAEAFAALFTPEADYVTGAGEWLRGSPAIAGLLADPSNLPRVAIVGSVSIRGSETAATAIFRWETLPGAEPVRRGIVTCVVVRRGSDLRVDRLQNTDETGDAER